MERVNALKGSGRYLLRILFQISQLSQNRHALKFIYYLVWWRQVLGLYNILSRNMIFVQNRYKYGTLIICKGFFSRMFKHRGYHTGIYYWISNTALVNLSYFINLTLHKKMIKFSSAVAICYTRSQHLVCTIKQYANNLLFDDNNCNYHSHM